MSYIRAKKTGIEQGAVSQDGAVHLELPDHGEAGDRMEVDANMDDEMLSAVLRMMTLVDDLDEGEALVVWKVVF